MTSYEERTPKERAILSILYFGKTVYGKTKLQKLAFLSQREIEGGPFEETFDFAPYYYGPFTPELYDTIEDLEDQSLISVEERESEKDGHTVTAEDYELTPQGKKEAERYIQSLPEDQREKVQELVEKYNFKSLSDLLEYTYSEYPDMAQRSEWDGP